MNGPRVRSEEDIMYYHLYVKSKKKNKVQMNLFTKKKQSHRCRKQSYVHQGA